jgi:hypothetical protein
MINGALSDAHHTLRSDAENSIVPNEPESLRS